MKDWAWWACVCESEREGVCDGVSVKRVWCVRVGGLDISLFPVYAQVGVVMSLRTEDRIDSELSTN